MFSLTAPLRNLACYDLVTFHCLIGNVIKLAVSFTHGAAGSPGVDACAWLRMCTPFEDGSASFM